ncbi:MAG: hypothetical protein RLZZ223_57 [Candidatus Parcubacteria bacterium]
MYGTSDFCVMTYEAKTGSATIAATTEAAGAPVVNISQTNAITACSLNGAGYGLINNAEWMTIARNIEGVAINWTGGAVGSGGLWRGHSDGTPNNTLAASTDNNDPYNGTGNVSPSTQKRTYTLSNGEIIWDLSGNVQEWTNDIIMGSDKPTGGSEFTSITGYGSLRYDLIRPSNNTWNGSQNMGYYFAGSNTGGPFIFLRGGTWDAGTPAGVFTLNLFYTSVWGNNIGFRCVVR